MILHLPPVMPARRVEPEWLDQLAADDARAAHSRRDLRRVNTLMANPAIVARQLRRCYPHDAPRTLADIGAGDGTVMLRVAERTRWKNVRLVLLDRQRVVSRQTCVQFQSLGWEVECVTADVFEWLARACVASLDVIVANLFLHHFEAVRLSALLALCARRARLLIACEPRRSATALAASRLLGLIGCNDVTRHDAVASVHAGFSASELCGLWPHDETWVLHEHPVGLFSHCFVARRSDA